MTQYSGIKGWYFSRLLQTLVTVGTLSGKRILDFGCGTQELKKFLPGEHYIGYDIDPNLSDIDVVDGVAYDVMIANEVFYEMTEGEIEDVLKKLKPPILIVGISRQGILNKIGAMLLHPTALDRTKTPPKKELEILQRQYRILKKKNVWLLADVYLLKRLHENG